jgi:hypothetical protein
MDVLEEIDLVVILETPEGQRVSHPAGPNMRLHSVRTRFDMDYSSEPLTDLRTKVQAERAWGGLRKTRMSGSADGSPWSLVSLHQQCIATTKKKPKTEKHKRFTPRGPRITTQGPPGAAEPALRGTST